MQWLWRHAWSPTTEQTWRAFKTSEIGLLDVVIILSPDNAGWCMWSWSSQTWKIAWDFSPIRRNPVVARVNSHCFLILEPNIWANKIRLWPLALWTEQNVFGWCQPGCQPNNNVPFGVTYVKIGTIQRRLAWPLHKDDTLSRSGRPTGLNIYFIKTLDE